MPRSPRRLLIAREAGGRTFAPGALTGAAAGVRDLRAPGAGPQEDADSISSMFLVTTSMVWPSSSVGLNSTTSVPA